jgi:hypothetical protein
MERAADPARQKRLEAALDALLGPIERRGNRHIYRLHAAVAAADVYRPAESARAFEKAILDDLPVAQRTPFKSRRSALKDSSNQVRGNSDSAKLDKLEDFSRDNHIYLSHVALLRDHPEEQDMWADLQEVRRILHRWNIPCTPDAESLGMASLWGRKRP